MDFIDLALVILPLLALPVFGGYANAISPGMTSFQKTTHTIMVCAGTLLIAFVMWFMKTFQLPTVEIIVLAFGVYWATYGTSYYYFGKKTAAKP